MRDPPNAGKKLRPAHRDPEAASESPAINDAKGKHKINLLTLPVEILPTSCEQV
jgi:hypothetical protein